MGIRETELEKKREKGGRVFYDAHAGVSVESKRYCIC